jgi:hypothetical protein
MLALGYCGSAFTCKTKPACAKEGCVNAAGACAGPTWEPHASNNEERKCKENQEETITWMEG